MTSEAVCVTVKVPESAKYAGDNPWLVFKGEGREVQDNIVRTFGLTVPEGATLAQVVLAAQASMTAEANAVRGGLTAVPAAAPQTPTNVVTPPAGTWGSAPQATPQAAAPVGGAQPHPEGKQCSACGSVLQYKVVNRKSDGRQFKFWACPNQRSQNDGHQSEFAN